MISVRDIDSYKKMSSAVASFLRVLVFSLAFQSNSCKSAILSNVGRHHNSNTRTSRTDVLPNDTFVILSPPKLFHSSLTSNGFIYLFKDEMQNVYPTIKFYTFEFPLCELSGYLESEKFNVLRSLQPSKILVLLDNDFTDCNLNQPETWLLKTRSNLEIFLTKLLLDETTPADNRKSDQQIYVSPFCFVNDCTDFRDGNDLVFEDFLQSVQVLPRLLEKVTILDLLGRVLKHLEFFQKAESSLGISFLLTYDGTSLSPLGHSIIASELLKVFCIHCADRIRSKISHLNSAPLESVRFFEL